MFIDNDNNKKSRRELSVSWTSMELSSIKQVGLCLIASANLISSGMTVAFPAVAIPAMKQINSGLVLTNGQVSWIASISQLTMIAGSIIIGPLLDKWGRKLGFILTGFTAVLGWIIVGAMPYSLVFLYIGRLLVGLSNGFCGAVTSVFMAEVTTPKIRNVLTVSKNMAFSTGVTLMYIIGMIFKDDWSKMAYCGVLVPLMCLLLALVCLPESSVWLQSNYQHKTKSTYVDLLQAYRRRPEVYKPMNIMNSILVLRQLSGTSVILSYTVVLIKITGVRGDPHVVAIILGVTRILAGLIGCALSGWLGRRVPVAWSGAVMTVSMLWLARNIKADNEEPTYADTMVLIVFMLASTIYSSICQGLLGEVFPTDVRGLCTGVSTCLTYTSSFVALKLYPELVVLMGQTNLLLLYGTFCASGAILAILTLPETKDRTLAEIQVLFTNKVPQLENLPKDSANPAIEIELLEPLSKNLPVKAQL